MPRSAGEIRRALDELARSGDASVLQLGRAIAERDALLDRGIIGPDVARLQTRVTALQATRRTQARARADLERELAAAEYTPPGDVAAMAAQFRQISAAVHQAGEDATMAAMPFVFRAQALLERSERLATAFRTDYGGPAEDLAAPIQALAEALSQVRAHIAVTYPHDGRGSSARRD